MTNNLYFIDEAENNMGLALVLTAPWSDDLIDVISRENISVLRLSHSAGWKEKDISFLEKLQNTALRGVEVYGWNVKDVRPLQYIPGLEYLGLQCEFSKAPDFAQFGQLRICKLFWRTHAKSILDCPELELLNIVNYPDEDLTRLKNLTGLRRLQITSRKLVTLAGIESLKYLSVLDLADCHKLVSLEGVEKCQALQVIELENCKIVNSVASLSELAELKSVVLTNCGKIESLQPLIKCQLLESLSFGGDTDVADGELTPLLKIPELKRMWFTDRRHYTHKRDQVISILS